MSKTDYNFIPDPEDRILPDIWYEQLMDPPDPSPRPYTNPIFIELVSSEIKNIKPAVGTLGSSVRQHTAFESSI